MKRRSGAADLAYPVTTLLDQPGCAFCRRTEQVDAQAALAFLTEGKYEPDVRARVGEAGGFCSHHTRLLHELARRDDLTASLAEVYEMVIRALDADLGSAGRAGRGRKRAGLLPRDAGPCLLCGQRADSEQRMAGFLAAHLAESAAGRDRYAAGAGFCLPHLRLLGERCDPDTLAFLRRRRGRPAQRRVGAARALPPAPRLPPPRRPSRRRAVGRHRRDRPPGQSAVSRDAAGLNLAGGRQRWPAVAASCQVPACHALCVRKSDRPPRRDHSSAGAT